MAISIKSSLEIRVSLIRFIVYDPFNVFGTNSKGTQSGRSFKSKLHLWTGWRRRVGGSRLSIRGSPCAQNQQNYVELRAANYLPSQRAFASTL